MLAYRTGLVNTETKPGSSMLSDRGFVEVHPDIGI